VDLSGVHRPPEQSGRKLTGCVAAVGVEFPKTPPHGVVLQRD
jgi:hypothetical protein